MRVELVQWLDTGLAVNDGWMDTSYVVSRAHHLARPVTSSGIVMHEDEEAIVLAGAYAKDTGQWLNAHAILKSAIVGRRTLLEETL